MPLSIDALLNLSKSFTQTVAPTKAPFSNQDIEDMNAGQFLLFCFILFILTYIIMFIGAFFFNMSVVKLKIFPTLKTITTLDFFCLYIVIHLLFC